MIKNQKTQVMVADWGIVSTEGWYRAKGFSEEIWPVLDEYFSRYKLEFGLTNEEHFDRFQKIMENLQTITIEDIVDSNAMGIYYKNEHKIVVDAKKAKKHGASASEILFHEMNHAGEGNYADMDYSGLQKYSYEFKQFIGTGLNEIVTEMKSSRIANNNRIDMYNNKNEHDKYIIRTHGYGNIIYAGSLFHNALGISEKEFLKLTDKNYHLFEIETCADFNSFDDSRNYIETMKFSIDIIHKILYENNKNPSQDDMDNLLLQTQNITNNALWAADTIITNQVKSGKYSQIKDFSTKWRFHLKNIIENSKEGMQTVNAFSAYSKLTPEPLTEEEQASTLEIIEKLQTKILGIEAILESKKALNEDEKKELLNTLVSDEQLNISTLENIYNKCGKNIKNSIFKMYLSSPNEKKVPKLLKDEYGKDKWDNKKINKCLSVYENAPKVKLKDKIKKIFSEIKSEFGTFKNDFLSLFGRKQLALNKAKDIDQTLTVDTPALNLSDFLTNDLDLTDSEEYIKLNDKISIETSEQTIDDEHEVK